MKGKCCFASDENVRVCVALYTRGKCNQMISMMFKEGLIF